MSDDVTHLDPNGEMSAHSEPHASQQQAINAETPDTVREPHVEFLADELSSVSEEEVDKKPSNEPRKRGKRGPRMRYTDEEIKQMRAHLQEQLQLSPRPSLHEVWAGYASKVFG